MNETALVFIDEKYNKNSIAALCGAIELDQRLQDLVIHCVKSSEVVSSFENLLTQHEHLIIAFSFCTPNLIEIATLLSAFQNELSSAERNRIRFIAGGPHPSGDYEETIALGFDVVVLGEGEKTLPDLIAAMLKEQDLKDITGIAYPEQRGIVRTGKRERIHLDAFPPFSTKYKRFGAIEITRGCPWACSYCQTPFLLGGKMRHRSIDNIARYAEIAKSHGLKDLRFITPDAFAYGSDGKMPNIGKVEELLRTVAKIYGKRHVYFGSFPSEVRPDMVSSELIQLVVTYAANNNIIIGAQSGSQRVLDSMHRGHTVEDVKNAVKIVTNAGLIANVDFIFGLPGETPQDRQDTLKLMDVLTLKGARIHSHTFMPLAGTPLAKARPGKVDTHTRKLLNRLASEGKQYGSWQQQEEVANTLAKVRKNRLDGPDRGLTILDGKRLSGSD